MNLDPPVVIIAVMNWMLAFAIGFTYK